ncbi:MAG TPA: OFA family MFS transporter [Ignavibacteria bacterium]|nr:OFA family MFS transporter [Ignavibacteria bacterium]
MKNKGIAVTAAGSLISLVLGILYAWSILKVAIEESIKAGTGFNWEISSLNDPYSVALLAFAFTMIVSGKTQDKLGPRITTFIGVFLVTGGLLLSALSTDYVVWIIGYGIMTGMGIGFGYAAITPVAIKWFPPQKTGLITGIVVSGFGLASVYIAPLYTYLIGKYGISGALVIFAVGFFVISFISTLFLKNPSDDYIRNINQTASNSSVKRIDDGISTGKMLRSPSFYVLWFVYFAGAGAGLMVIGFLTEMVKKGLGESAFIAVAILAVGNAGGRLVAGWISDKIGRIKTLLILYSAQALLMFISVPVSMNDSPGVVIPLLLATLIGFNYGSNLALFPSLSKDKWGLKNFGINYGLLFTSWGLGGFILSRVSQMIKASTGTFEYSFYLAGILLVVSGVTLALQLRVDKN